ncbi:hypothetical protein [Gordonia amicalis]|uniref:Replication protein n=1 Tax=Gordonia amicalis TaxID=89053 RepID=A0ABU4DKP5_9ACTN|nr:hypothetical protein [Gordonia amicalis]MDV6309986.1 hypothetical protein [Gordonia amicalis]
MIAPLLTAAEQQSPGAFTEAMAALLEPLCLTARVSLAFAVTCRLLDALETQQRNEIERLNAEQRGCRTWQRPTPERTTDGRAPAQVPCWTSREAWLKAAATLLATAEGAAARRRHHRVAAATVMAAATAHAHYAETRTGRHMTASLRTLASKAGLSLDQIKDGRRVLRTLGLLVDVAYGQRLTGIEIMAARAHHGGTQLRVASQISLTMPKNAVAAVADTEPTPAPDQLSQTPSQERRQQSNGCPPLSRQGSSRALFLSNSSTFSKEKRTFPSKSLERGRSLPIQKLAAGIVARCRGLDPDTDALASPRRVVPKSWRRPDFQRKHHLGRICDAITDAGIDPSTWTPAAVVARLNDHGRNANLSWPNTIDNPAAYLRWRLGQIDWATPSPDPAKTTPAAAAGHRPPAAHRPAADSALRARAYEIAAAACGWNKPTGGANE